MPINRGALPGQVLQVATFTDAGGSATTSSFTNVSQSFKSFTPKSANSRILLECSFGITVGITGGVNTTGSVVFYDTIGATTFGTTDVYSAANASGGLQFQGKGSLQIELANSSLAARSFALRANTNQNGNTVSVQNHFWIITEIAAG
jgi:hypothetical protein